MHTILSAFQFGIIVLGTIVIRAATNETLLEFSHPPVLAMWIREWGVLFLLVPALWLILSTRAARKDHGDERLWIRLTIGAGLTMGLGYLFWNLWDRCSPWQIL
ncbi:hypothetical protein [Luteolibacter marinus]|uniref:hypothetical protein n=1 Tax=Luteolibacter marinus TaxID=2776705 RepID=UPI00186900E6|nr:hypothetical protein [Luteolibacter marinus]